MGKPCGYVFPDSHERAGESCGSYWIWKHELNTLGFCFSHCVKEGIVPQEILEKASKKKSETMKKVWSSKNLPKDADVEVAKGKTEGPSRTEEKYTEELFHKLVCDRNVSIQSMVNQLQNEGVNINDTLSIPQGLFAIWWMADPKTRRPETIDQFAKIVNIALYRVRKWLDEPWFENKLENERLRRMKLLAPYMDKVTAVRALGGDKSALAAFYKLTGNLTGDNVGNKEDFTKYLPDHLVKEAVEATELEDKSGLNMTKDEEKVEKRVIDGFLDLHGQPK